jgi:hypothetical protein
LLVCSFLPHNDTLMFDGYCLSLKCPVLLDQYRAIVAHFKTPLNIVKLTEVSLKIYISLASYLLTGYSRKYHSRFEPGGMIASHSLAHRHLMLLSLCILYGRRIHLSGSA